MGPNLFGCPFCQFTHKRNWAMKRHILRHTGEKPFSCNYCPYSYSRKDKLKEHTISKHSIPAKIECWFHWNRNTCLDLLDLIRAMILVKFLWLQTLPIKFGPNQYGCPFCLSTQKTSWLIKRHILRHTREKPFGCQLCEYSSSRKDQLQSHMNYRHSK